MHDEMGGVIADPACPACGLGESTVSSARMTSPPHPAGGAAVREGQHVGRLVLAPEREIERLNRAVAGGGERGVSGERRAPSAIASGLGGGGEAARELREARHVGAPGGLSRESRWRVQVPEASPWRS